VIGLDQEEPVIFQPEAHSPVVLTMHQKGSLDQWHAFVVRPCIGNPYLLFSLFASYAPPLLKHLRMDCGGFHFYGASSRGKTTLLQVAASSWGCGIDPASGDNSFVGRWNSTGNAFEATAAAHNDGILLLDEMGTCSASNFGALIYGLFGGEGKKRLNKQSGLRSTRSWRILALSTGELSTSQRISEEAGRKALAGQLVRLADIPINNGIIIDTHGKASDEFVTELKYNCGEYYGVSAPLFIEGLVGLSSSSEALTNTLRTLSDTAEGKLLAGLNLESRQRRVVKRFAMVVVAGWLAIRFNIIRCEEREVMESVRAVMMDWLGDNSNIPEGQRGLEAVKNFILRNPDRFRPIGNKNSSVRNLAGFLDTSSALYLLTTEGFSEACAGFNKDMVLSELDRLDFLMTGEAGRMNRKFTVLGVGRTRLYGIREGLLGHDYAD